jgi:hypothetical protein
MGIFFPKVGNTMYDAPVFAEQVDYTCCTTEIARCPTNRGVNIHTRISTQPQTNGKARFEVRRAVIMMIDVLRNVAPYSLVEH